MRVPQIVRTFDNLDGREHSYRRHVIDVVLPALNEAAAVPVVLAELPPGFEAIVVDNGSTDGTGDIARSLGARVVFEPARGFGAACWTGLNAARTDVVCFMDCDASLRGLDLARVGEPVVCGAADLVLGARCPAPGAWPMHARVANRALAWEVHRRTGLALRDIGPMRAARRLDLLSLGIRDRRFGWPLEMVMRAGAAHWRVEEVDVAYVPRIGRSKVTGSAIGAARALRDTAAVLR
jgi:glycosyltransferase involved in cell wall biosynthesis